MFCPFDRGFKCADCPFSDFGKSSKNHHVHTCNKLNFSLSSSASKPVIFVENSKDSGRKDLLK
jgi:hypothetical protein